VDRRTKISVYPRHYFYTSSLFFHPIKSITEIFICELQILELHVFHVNYLRLLIEKRYKFYRQQKMSTNKHADLKEDEAELNTLIRDSV